MAASVGPVTHDSPASSPSTESTGARIHGEADGPDPFTLPAETPFRFALLVIAVVGSSLFAFRTITFTAHADEFVAVVRRCERQAREQSGPPLGNPADAVLIATQCRQAFERQQVREMLLGVAALAIVTAGLVVLTPWLRNRRRSFVPVSPRETPELYRELEALQRDAGVAAVHFEIEPLDPRTSAFAYGLPGHRRVALRGGLVVLQVTDPSVFRAIVLHELAHVRNRDVDQTYIAICASAAFVLVAVIPFLVSLGGTAPSLAVTWRAAALGALVYLLLLALLRSRERYADARAARWGAGAALGEVLTRRRRPTQNRFRRMLAMHPDPGLRADTLVDPQPLFRVGAIDGLAVGLVASLAAPEISAAVGLHLAASVLSPAWGAVPFAPLLAGFLVVGLWRQQLHESAGGPPSRAWPVGVGVASGLALGPSLSLTEAYVPLAAEGANALAWHASWTVLVIVLVAPLVAWIVESGRTTTGRRHALGDAAVRQRCALTVGLCTPVFVYVLYALAHVRLMDQIDLAEASPVEFMIRPFATAAAVLAPEVGLGWLQLGGLLAALGLPWVGGRMPRRAVTRTVMIGVVVGAVGTVLIYGSAAVMARHLSLEVRWPHPFLDEFGLGVRRATMALGVLGAAAAAVTYHRRPLAAGGVAAVAAAVSGALMLALGGILVSCVSVAATSPFINEESLTAECPAVTGTAALAHVLVLLQLTGTLMGAVLALPLLLRVVRAVVGRPDHRHPIVFGDEAGRLAPSGCSSTPRMRGAATSLRSARRTRTPHRTRKR